MQLEIRTSNLISEPVADSKPVFRFFEIVSCELLQDREMGTAVNNLLGGAEYSIENAATGGTAPASSRMMDQGKKANSPTTKVCLFRSPNSFACGEPSGVSMREAAMGHAISRRQTKCHAQ